MEMGQFKGESMLDIFVAFISALLVYGVYVFFKDLYDIYRYRSGNQD
jgi:hypothetical protein